MCTRQFQASLEPSQSKEKDIAHRTLYITVALTEVSPGKRSQRLGISEYSVAQFIGIYLRHPKRGVLNV